MTSRTRFVAIVISAPVIAFTVIGGLLGHAMARADETYANLRVFNDVVSLILSNYVEQPNMDSVMRGAMRGLAEGLDSDSAYLTPPQARALETGDHPGTADVGMTLTHQYYLRVVATRDDSPSARAGIRPGDFVRLVDSRPTRRQRSPHRQLMTQILHRKKKWKLKRRSIASPAHFATARFRSSSQARSWKT